MRVSSSSEITAVSQAGGGRGSFGGAGSKGGDGKSAALVSKGTIVLELEIADISDELARCRVFGRDESSSSSVLGSFLGSGSGVLGVSGEAGGRGCAEELEGKEAKTAGLLDEKPQCGHTHSA